VQDYERARPGYPPEVLSHLARVCGLLPRHIFADIGSGTGMLSEMFLKNGNAVYGVEPNAAMRAAAERNLSGFPNFHSVNGAAEATTLPSGCADFVTAATAFHWFDREAARVEFARILRPGGWVVLLWNVRRVEHDDFQRAYEDLILRFGTDYRDVKSRWGGEESLRSFFAPAEMQQAEFPIVQQLDWEGLRGRVLSASYAPRPGDAQYGLMAARLREIFDACSAAGRVTLYYDTKMYCAQWKAAPA